MIYTKYFAYKPTTKTIDIARDNVESREFKNIQTAFVQVEAPGFSLARVFKSL